MFMLIIMLTLSNYYWYRELQTGTLWSCGHRSTPSISLHAQYLIALPMLPSYRRSTGALSR